MHPILEIRNATRRFNAPDGSKIVALDSVSISVEQNEFVTLLGPSGCGKTTLLRAISGFEDLEAGAIKIDGVDVSGLPAHKRPVNTVFQKYALFPHLNVFRNVAYSLEVTHIAAPEIKQRVGAMLELVGLGEFAERRINQLSGGQQQRVALARSLVAQPKILLLDEPLSALDRNLRKKMQQELKSIQENVGIAFVFVTHDQEEALTMSDRIAVLNNGRVQQLGSPEDLYRRPENEFVARFIGEGNLFEGRVQDTGATATTFLLRSGATVTLPKTGLGVDQEVRLLVRPEDMRIGVPGRCGGLEFKGTVDQVSFVGSDYQITAAVDEGKSLKAIVRPDVTVRVEIPEPGDPISLYVPEKALHIIRAPRTR